MEENTTALLYWICFYVSCLVFWICKCCVFICIDAIYIFVRHVGFKRDLSDILHLILNTVLLKDSDTVHWGFKMQNPSPIHCFLCPVLPNTLVNSKRIFLSQWKFEWILSCGNRTHRGGGGGGSLREVEPCPADHPSQRSQQFAIPTAV
jgi:hypothetical protein